MKAEQNITPEESFNIIGQMIQAAKNEQKDNGKGWIIWGWFIFFTSIFSYFNLQFNWAAPFFFWNVCGIISLIFLFYKYVLSFFVRKKEYVAKTYAGEIYQKLNIGFFVFMALIIVAMNFGVRPTKGFALLLGLYGFWMLIYGTLLNFFPSITGSFITWILAFCSLFVNSFGWTMILHALAVLVGYIIPGYIANIQFNKLNRDKQY